MCTLALAAMKCSSVLCYLAFCVVVLTLPPWIHPMYSTGTQSYSLSLFLFFTPSSLTSPSLFFSLCPSVSRSTFASSRSFSLPNSPSGLVPSLLHECLVSHGVLLVVTLPYSRTHTHSAWANRHAFSGKLPLFLSLLFLFPLSLLSSLQSSNTVLIG